MEEYRSLIGDRFVLHLLNRKMIKPDDSLCRHPKQKTFANENVKISDGEHLLTLQYLKPMIMGINQFKQYYYSH